VLFSILYLILRGLLRLAGPERESRDREVEILVLRHQLKVLSRKTGRSNSGDWTGVLLAAAARVLPRERELVPGWALEPASLAPPAGSAQVNVRARGRGGLRLPPRSGS
jgi:hypothetical protein